jgi:hypothetical protein
VWLLAVLVGIPITAGAVLGLAHRAGAQNLPGTGYTADYTWNCGQLAPSGTQTYYQPGNCLGPSCATRHSYGWGSADYDGTGTVGLEVATTCNSSGCPYNWGNQGFNLVRACYAYPGCNDQDAHLYFMDVRNLSAGYRKILGHGKA